MLGPLHLVSAWATEHHLSLGQVATAANPMKSRRFPSLLELLDLHGAVVTIDAMGCQKAIASKIVERGGDYVLMVKDNQPTLAGRHPERPWATPWRTISGDAVTTNTAPKTVATAASEKRHYTILIDPKGIRQKDEWENLHVGGDVRARTPSRARRSRHWKRAISSAAR